MEQAPVVAPRDTLSWTTSVLSGPRVDFNSNTLQVHAAVCLRLAFETRTAALHQFSVAVARVSAKVFKKSSMMS